MLRHVGKIVNTDTRCFVVFLQIPNRADHALVLPVDNLPDFFESAVKTVLESKEGQSAVNLADVLARRTMPQTGVGMLQALHNAGLLHAVHVDNIVMLPKPNMSVPLRQIVESIGGAPLPQQTNYATEKYNPYAANIAARAAEDRANIARTLLSEAADLNLLANKKVKEAYQYAPELALRVESSMKAAGATALPVEPSVIVNNPEDAPKASIAEIERLASLMDGSLKGTVTPDVAESEAPVKKSGRRKKA